MIAITPAVKRMATVAEKEGGNGSRSTQRLAAADALPVRVSAAREKETVLLVESETIMRSALAGVLRHFGYRVMPAGGAAEAQRLAQRSGPIQLLFLNLSEQSDIELAAWFQARYCETRIVLATDCLWDVSCHFAESTRMAYLAKPYTSRELASLLRRVLS